MQRITEIGIRKVASIPQIDCRIAVYSHDTFGLGNIRRMLAICQHMLDHNRNFTILLITGSPMIHRLPLPAERFDYVKLPCLSRSSAEKYLVKSLGTSLEHTMELRAQMIKTTLIGFQPDLVLVDKKPCGVTKELIPALEASFDVNPTAHWVLLLRDILDAPDRTRQVWHKHDYFDVINRYYSQVLVVGSREIFDVGKEYDFPTQVRTKMKYCGYIHKPLTRTRNLLPRKHRKTILVTPGGGQDGFRLIRTYLQGLTTHTLEDWHSTIITGPEMDGRAREDITRLASATGASVKVETFTADMQNMMFHADVVVAMGGYNTVCEIVSMGKPAVILPRKHPVQEQWIRAQRFAQRGLLCCLDPDQLTPQRLIGAVEGQLNRTGITPAVSMPPVDWQGLERVSQSIRSLLAKPGIAACNA